MTQSIALPLDSEVSALVIEDRVSQSPLAYRYAACSAAMARVLSSMRWISISTKANSSRCWVKAAAARPLCCARWLGSICLTPGRSARPSALLSCSRSLACCLGRRCGRTSRSVMKPRSAGPARRARWPKSGLPAARADWPRNLSGGQAQRVALARALVPDPALLLLDEPFAALDALTRIKMHGLVKELVARHHPGVLLVTHDVDEALTLADRILVMRSGRIAASFQPKNGHATGTAVHAARRTGRSVSLIDFLHYSKDLTRMNDSSLSRRQLLRAAGGLLAGAAAGSLFPARAAEPRKLTRNTDTVRIGWGYGSLPDIAKQRGVFEKTLAAKGIKVEWIGPFPNHAPSIQAVVGGSADFGFWGSTTPALAAMLAGSPHRLQCIRRLFAALDRHHREEIERHQLGRRSGGPQGRHQPFGAW